MTNQPDEDAAWRAIVDNYGELELGPEPDPASYRKLQQELRREHEHHRGSPSTRVATMPRWISLVPA